jgi:hypothetical protein
LILDGKISDPGYTSLIRNTENYIKKNLPKTCTRAKAVKVLQKKPGNFFSYPLGLEFLPIHRSTLKRGNFPDSILFFEGRLLKNEAYLYF